MTDKIYTPTPSASQLDQEFHSDKAANRNVSHSLARLPFAPQDDNHTQLGRFVPRVDLSNVKTLIEQDERRRAKPALDLSWFKPPRVVRSDTDWCAVGGPGYVMQAWLTWPKPEPLLLSAGPMPVALLPATIPLRIDTSPIVRASQEQGKNDMVLSYQTPAIQPATHTTAPIAPRQWLTISDTCAAQSASTPGLSNTISLKETAAVLAAARKAGSPWLIDPGRVRTGNGRAL